MKYLVLLVALTFLGCPGPTPAPMPDAAPVSSDSSGVPSAGAPSASAPVPGSAAPGSVTAAKAAASASTLAIANDTDNAVKVYIAFGANSVVLPSSQGWAFCQGSGLNCNFELAKHASQHTPLAGKYLNATLSFDKPVTCNTTKAEVNINNPGWYDIVDISLVDGFNKFVAVDTVSSAGPVTLGPPHGVSGNESVFGLYPNGCDICTTRQNPPCGMKSGADGCKKGTQYKPDVPCQWQGPSMGGGTHVTVRLLAGVPTR